MVIRKQASARTPASTHLEAWKAFEESQKEKIAACITQPSHADLAGQLSANLEPDAFGTIPDEVVHIISFHDSGWVSEDLAALEMSSAKTPISFLEVQPAKAINIWKRSIRDAEERALLAGILTSRHFCLLAPNDPEHEAFREQETARRTENEAGCAFSSSELEQYADALGFCDLLSLLLCSGIRQEVHLPLGHPADPRSRAATKITLSLNVDQVIFRESGIIRPGTTVHTTVWNLTEEAQLCSDRMEWTFA